MNGAHFSNNLLILRLTNNVTSGMNASLSWKYSFAYCLDNVYDITELLLRDI